MTIGDIYLFNGSEYRVLMFDDICLALEAKTHKGWNAVEHLGREVIFFITGKAFFMLKSRHIGFESYSNEEEKVIRADLPLSMLCQKEIHWRHVGELTNSENHEFLSNNALKLNSLYVYPKGKRWGQGKPVLINGEGNNSLDPYTILKKCAEIQIQHNSDVGIGTGLFRTGLKSKIPTYSIEDYYNGDFQIFRLYEENFDWASHFKSE